MPGMKSRLRDVIQALLFAYIPAFGVLGLVALLSGATGINAGNFTRDPANILRYPWWYGSVSYLGVLMWCSTAAACFVSVAATGTGSLRNVPVRWFLLASGVLTTALLFDDLFLFHEIVFPKVFDIPERFVHASYGLGLLLILVTFRATILKTDYLILLVAGGFLASSQVADTLTNKAADTSMKFLIEDGFKFLGIVGWLTYFTRVCVTWLRGSLSRSSHEESSPSERPG
jgi:hypothetical protein